MTLVAPPCWRRGVSNASSAIARMWFRQLFDGVAFPVDRVYIGRNTLRVGNVVAPEAA
jgi:hypothetical protein